MMHITDAERTVGRFSDGTATYGGLWDGYSIAIVNTPEDALLGTEPGRPSDVGLAWHIAKDGDMHIRLRSTGSADVGEMARQYRGDGTKHEAEFQLAWFVGVSFIRGLTGGRL